MSNEDKSTVTILMAEDDDGHAMLITRALLKSGIVHELKRFGNGQELLDFCTHSGASEGFAIQGSYVLLLDIRMPKVDGIDVLKELKGHEVLRNIPVVILTTTSNPDEVKLCHDLGCNAYVVKPVQHLEFGETIQRLGEFLQKMEVPVVEGELSKIC